jgi:hypothetical protein
MQFKVGLYTAFILRQIIRLRVSILHMDHREACIKTVSERQKVQIFALHNLQKLFTLYCFYTGLMMIHV